MYNREMFTKLLMSSICDNST